jgi:hypothetical protein
VAAGLIAAGAVARRVGSGSAATSTATGRRPRRKSAAPRAAPCGA